MSDLSVSLAQATSQLPVSSYFDEALFQQEQASIFACGPRYAGHRLAVPNVGDYAALAHEANGRALVHTEHGLELISNVCRHRQAVMLQGRGQLPGSSAHAAGNLVCPLHRWTYAANGTLLGAPHFQSDPCLHLQRWPTREWNGLVFEDNGVDVAQIFAQLGSKTAFDFSNYQYHSGVAHECAYNWKTFIEVYLEDYHVGPFHPGLGQFVRCDDLSWEFRPEYSVQTVGLNSGLANSGTGVYERWQQEVLRVQGGVPPQHGALWLTYHPNIMLEWYPNVLVVSTLHPRGPQNTMNWVEFFYPEEIIAFEPDFIKAQQAAYMETCAEDDEIALRMDAGRKALMLRGTNESGPYQSPMEDGMQHFHEWYRTQMLMHK